MTYPLFIVTGLSGSGKSTTARVVGKNMVDFNVFDMDIIVNNQDFQTASHNWLRIAYFTALCGRGTILFGAVPSPYNIEICRYFCYFNPIYYLILHCSDEIRFQRLTARGGWTLEGIIHTNIAASEMIVKAQTTFPPTPIIDTTDTPIMQVAADIKKWVLNYWN